MLPEALVAWLGTAFGRICAGAAIAVLTSGVIWGALKIHDNKVIASHEAKIDKATTNATHTIRASGARSTDPSVRGVIDPSTKDD
jgi:hypothetical protein